MCQYREADKTGSHIIPSFLMKRINGEGKRDHEVGFEIGNGVVKSYFGRDIYEDQRREITDQEETIGSRENLDVCDYVFCSDCEKYFGTLENAYATSLCMKHQEAGLVVNKKVSPTNALLFWCSLVWRSSTTEHLGCRLDSCYEERLRWALPNNCVDNLNVRYALYRCVDYGKLSDRGTAVCMDIKSNTVLLIVDDYMLVMIFDVCNSFPHICLMNMGFKLIPEKLNDGIKQEEVSLLPMEVYDLVMSSLVLEVFKSMKLPERISKLHEHLFGEFLPESIVSEVLDLILSHECKLGDRYSVKHYSWCYKEILKRYGFLQENENGTFSFLRPITVDPTL